MGMVKCYPGRLEVAQLGLGQRRSEGQRRGGRFGRIQPSSGFSEIGRKQEAVCGRTVLFWLPCKDLWEKRPCLTKLGGP